MPSSLYSRQRLVCVELIQFEGHILGRRDREKYARTDKHDERDSWEVTEKTGEKRCLPT
jgi:hypothetical protein